MKASDVPAKIQAIFGHAAGGAYIRTVPLLSQIGIVDGAASFETGFPPLNSVPVSAGGVPPFMQDENGILFALSAMLRWYNAGSPLKWDSTLSTSIGGYPKGALVQNTAGTDAWLCTADDNTTNPDAAGAGWIPYYGLSFGSSQGASGYQRLPGGLILQWVDDISVVGGSVPVYVTLPIPWPNNYITSVASYQASTPPPDGNVGSEKYVTNPLTQIKVASSSAFTCAVNLIAIGN